MGFFNAVKRAFGFGNSDFDDEEISAADYGIDATVTPLRQQKYQEEEQPEQKVEPKPAAPKKSPTEIASEAVPMESIFNTVVSIFNDTLPSFLQQTVDPEAQKKRIYDSLSADVKLYISNVHQSLMAACDQHFEAERRGYQEEIARLETRMRSTEDDEAEKGRRLLSAERQKRAINERVHDLEIQIAKLEAEREQYELENRTLVNKMRVMNVMGESSGDVDTKALSAKIAELENDKTALSAQLDETKAEAEKLKADFAAANEELAALRIKDSVSDTMFTDLNDRASAAQSKVKDFETEIAGLREQLTQARESEAYMKTQLDDAKAEAEIFSHDLEEARANLEMAARIQDEVEKIQDKIEKKNAQIAELTTELKHREDRIMALEKEEDSLRHTIENNIRVQAESEAALNARIAELESRIASEPAAETLKEMTPHPRRKQSGRISAIDEDLDNTDWLVATPPEGTSAKTPGVSDAEFGYQEPNRKNPPENSAQMSLF